MTTHILPYHGNVCDAEVDWKDAFSYALRFFLRLDTFPQVGLATFQKGQRDIISIFRMTLGIMLFCFDFLAMPRVSSIFEF